MSACPWRKQKQKILPVPVKRHRGKLISSPVKVRLLLVERVVLMLHDDDAILPGRCRGFELAEPPISRLGCNSPSLLPGFCLQTTGLGIAWARSSCLSNHPRMATAFHPRSTTASQQRTSCPTASSHSSVAYSHSVATLAAFMSGSCAYYCSAASSTVINGASPHDCSCPPSRLDLWRVRCFCSHGRLASCHHCRSSCCLDSAMHSHRI